MIDGALQKAIYAALVGVTTAGADVFDQVPEKRKDAFPRITIGDEQVLDDSNSCQDGWEVFSDVHCWSRPQAGSKLEVKTLAAEVVAAVRGITTVSGLSLVSIDLATSRTFRDSDGLTEHTAITFRALIDPA